MAKNSQSTTGGSKPEAKSTAVGSGARIDHRYHHRVEDTVAVTRDDLREVRTFGWLQEGLSGVGMFFFGGAFWQIVTILAAQTKFEFTPWLMVCVIAIVFGGLLMGTGTVLFFLKQSRLNKYFPNTKNPG